VRFEVPEGRGRAEKREFPMSVCRQRSLHAPQVNIAGFWQKMVDLLSKVTLETFFGVETFKMKRLRD
jgi:hypothetical protein